MTSSVQCVGAPTPSVPYVLTSPHSFVPTTTTGITHNPVHRAPPQVKLPKLTMKKFNGDITKWVTFWDSFFSSIHNNPALSNVDKFNYLTSLLESTAAEAIAGLTLTDVNYEEAVSILKRRFGNTQLIINRHMEALLNVTSVSSHQDIKGLRKLCDSVEAHMRGLRALNVPAQSYSGPLVSVLVNKLPPELKLIVIRDMTGETWDLERLMKIFERAVDARERVFVPTNTRRVQSRLPTAATLVASNSSSNENKYTCVYCDKDHTSNSCPTVTGAAKRKESLLKAGRCFVCLKRHHISRDCRSSFNCKKCRGRHHISICTRVTGKSAKEPTFSSDKSHSEGSKSNEVPQTTNSFCAGVPTQILLQTAKLRLVNSTGDGSDTTTRTVLDSGSQRTYVSSQLREQLRLSTISTEKMRIKTFGSKESCDETYDIVNLEIILDDGKILKITAIAVPIVCSPLTSQPIDASKDFYEHLVDLDLADSACSKDLLEVDVLIGSDWYWSLVTGRVIKGEAGPTAVHTKVGWTLSGPASSQTTINLTLSSTHTLKVDTFIAEPTLDDRLRQFWEMEALGISKDEPSVYEKFLQQISFDGHRYEVGLPWKEHHPPFPDHYVLCRKRLDGLLRRLKQTPELLNEYDRIICDQLKRGMIEKICPSDEDSDRVHYLPHHCIVRQDKATSKLRIVYDASARSTGPSLNDCLYTGPKFGQSIFDILVRFRHQRVALIGDIEKAFLMLSVRKRDRDSLRFLWSTNPNSERSELLTFRFTRVVFGVSSSPFLLNATINLHLETFREIDPVFVDKFLSSIYVDDLVSGSHDVQSTYDFYLKSKLRLLAAGFKLRKFITNSTELHSLIMEDKDLSIHENKLHVEEDQSYAKASFGVDATEAPGIVKVLGVRWDTQLDELQFDIGDVAQTMKDLEPTKRNLVGIAAKFFDPLDVVSPVTILFKIFCQQLCEAKIGWDDPLSDSFQERWRQHFMMLKGAKTIRVPRCVYQTTSPKNAKLIEFCDASAKAYAAVVYIRLEDETSVTVKFVASKTRVAPVIGAMIPRLELLSALVLSRLLTSIGVSLQSELPLNDLVCFTDSKASLYWIKGVHHEWKQFVENRVAAIRSLVSPDHWRHCPGKENPADIPSRGMSARALAESTVWLTGPEWLWHKGNIGEEDLTFPEIPEVCTKEVRRKDLINSIVGVSISETALDMSQAICPEKYSSSQRLFRVTALVLRFVRQLYGSVHKIPLALQPEAQEIQQAKLKWVKDMQTTLPNHKNFNSWKLKLGVFRDSDGVWRCGGRMLNTSLALGTQKPILLNKDHHLTTLLVLDAHNRVLHNGVRETLAELRSLYWLIRGRQIVKKMLRNCVICHKYEGAPCRGVSPPPLPEYRVRLSRPFQTTGVDFAGPLYIRTCETLKNAKTWLVLYTCYVTRAVHLDLVQDMTTDTFLRSFKRFVVRRGTPVRMISDNAKTFKSASTSIMNILKSQEVKRSFGVINMEWQFNLEKAPWQGGVFERMVKSAKRCLRKVIGKNCFTYDELLTLVIEVEGVLNSRPLTYVYAEDVTEPLTPSHLLVGYRILSLPDVPVPESADDDYTPERLTRRASHLAKTLEKFWKRWKLEYLLELREFHHSCQQGTRGTTHSLQPGEVVTVYDESHPRGMWRLGRIEELIPGADGKIRGVCIKVISEGGQINVVRRPVQHIYPLEVRSRPSENVTAETPSVVDNTSTTTAEEADSTRSRSSRRAAVQARDRITAVMMDDD